MIGQPPGATMLARHAAAVAAALALGATAATARADDGPSCRFVCAPDFKVEPTITFEHLGPVPSQARS